MGTMAVRIAAAAHVVDVRTDEGRDVRYVKRKRLLTLHAEGVDGRRHIGIHVSHTAHREVALQNVHRRIRENVHGTQRRRAVGRQAVEVEVILAGDRTVLRVARAGREGGTQREAREFCFTADDDAVGIRLRGEIRTTGADTLQLRLAARHVGPQTVAFALHGLFTNHLTEFGSTVVSRRKGGQSTGRIHGRIKAGRDVTAIADVTGFIREKLIDVVVVGFHTGVGKCRTLHGRTEDERGIGQLRADRTVVIHRELPERIAGHEVVLPSEVGVIVARQQVGRTLMQRTDQHGLGAFFHRDGISLNHGRTIGNVRHVSHQSRVRRKRHGTRRRSRRRGRRERTVYNQCALRDVNRDRRSHIGRRKHRAVRIAPRHLAAVEGRRQVRIIRAAQDYVGVLAHCHFAVDRITRKHQAGTVGNRLAVHVGRIKEEAETSERVAFQRQIATVAVFAFGTDVERDVLIPRHGQLVNRHGTGDFVSGIRRLIEHQFRHSHIRAGRDLRIALQRQTRHRNRCTVADVDRTFIGRQLIERYIAGVDVNHALLGRHVSELEVARLHSERTVFFHRQSRRNLALVMDGTGFAQLQRGLLAHGDVFKVLAVDKFTVLTAGADELDDLLRRILGLDKDVRHLLGQFDAGNTEALVNFGFTGFIGVNLDRDVAFNRLVVVFDVTDIDRALGIHALAVEDQGRLGLLIERVFSGLLVEVVVERIGESERTARERELVVLTAGVRHRPIGAQTVREDLIGGRRERAVDEFHLGPVGDRDRLHRDQGLVRRLVAVSTNHEAAAVYRERPHVDDGVVTLHNHFGVVVRKRNALLEVVRAGFDISRHGAREDRVRRLLEKQAFNASCLVGAFRFFAVYARDELAAAQNQRAVGHLEFASFIEILVVVPATVFEEEVLNMHR